MHAYLFTAVIIQSQVRPTPNWRGQTENQLQTWDSTQSIIICAENPDNAHELFERWVHHVPEGENPIEVEVKKLVVAQIVEDLFTESDPESIDWTQISARIEPTLQSAEGEHFEQGYWVDVNAAVPAHKLSANIDALQESLPEDVRSGLNWSAEKQHFFILSALSPPAPPSEPADELESDVESAAIREEDGGESDREDMFSELAEKEAAALIRARNSAVAAWLWRRFATDTKLAANDIAIEPWCGIIFDQTENS